MGTGDFVVEGEIMAQRKTAWDESDDVKLMILAIMAMVGAGLFALVFFF